MPLDSSGPSHSRETEVLVVELTIGLGCPTGAVCVCVKTLNSRWIYAHNTK